MKILIFAGTSEGKALSSLLADQGHSLTVTVATDYGRDVFEGFFQALKHNQNINLLEGRLNKEEMSSLMKIHDLVFDATHPYATEVSQNIVSACQADQKPYIRIIRENPAESDISSDHIYVKDQEEAIDFMNAISDKILLTTGSKDLARYAGVNDYKERLYPRILPDMASLKMAYDSGYKKSSIICMQGPFTSEVNAAMLKMTGARYLLTKETGDAGGFLEKLKGCQMAGAQAIIIKRPTEEIDRLQENIPNGSLLDRNLDMISISLKDLESFLDWQAKNQGSQGQEGGSPSLENMKSPLGQGDENPKSDQMKSKPCQPCDFSISDIRAFLQDPPQAPQLGYRFPLFVDLHEKTVTVIGSGRIAQRRIKILLDYGAHVRVISPQAEEEISFTHPNVSLINRAYQTGDLQGSLIAVVATDNREVNHQAGKEAEELGIFASIADKKEESSFYFPALWTGQGLSLGLVGDGTDHRYMKMASDKIKDMLNNIDLRGME